MFKRRHRTKDEKILVMLHARHMGARAARAGMQSAAVFAAFEEGYWLQREVTEYKKNGTTVNTETS